MKRKVLKTTVAASLVFGSIAGLPLSGTGLQELLGGKVAYASLESSDPLPAETNEWLQRILAVYGQLTPEELQFVNNFLTAVAGVNFADASNDELVAPLVTFINAKQDVANEVQKLETLQVVALLASALSASDQDTLSKKLNGFRSAELVRTWTSKILAGSGVSLDGENSLQFVDLIHFLDASQSAITAQFTLDKALLYLNAQKNGELLTTQRANVKADLKAAFETVLGNTSLKLSAVMSYYTSNPGEKSALADALAETYLNFAGKFQNGSEATTAMMKGLVRSEAKLTQSSGGTELTPELKLFNLNISSLVNWGIETENSPISFTSGKFVLGSSADNNTSVTASVYAKDIVYQELIYKGNITLIRSVLPDGDTTTPPPATNPDEVTAPVDRPALAEAANEAITTAKQQLENASPQEKGKIIQEAIKQVKDAIKKISKVSLSNAVTVLEGKATVAVDHAAVLEQMKEIQDQVAALNTSLTELDPNASADAEFTLDLGDVDAADINVPLAGAILEGAKAAGIKKMTVQANGVGVGFNPNQFSGSTDLAIQKISDAAAADVTDKPLASDVVEFTFTSESGEEIDEFEEPIELVLRIRPDAKVNQSLLAVGKIVDGQFIIYGGTVVNGEIRVSRTSLSTYTVVENKVEFNDTDSVSAWAGTEIEVVAAKGIVEGRGAGEYDPTAEVTRAEFAKMISKALGIDGGSAAENFSDVSASDWFQSYVAAVQKWGITNGRTPERFEPNAKITRAEMATMIARGLQAVRGTANVTSSEDVLAQFADSDQVHVSLQDGVAFAADLGIILGLPEGDFAPNANTTRAEAAVMIYRLLQQQ